MVMGSKYALLLCQKNDVHLAFLKVDFVIFVYINNIHSLVKCDIVVQKHSHYQVTMYTCLFFCFCNHIIVLYVYINCGMTANMLRVKGMAKDCCVQREVIAYKMFSRVINNWFLIVLSKHFLRRNEVWMSVRWYMLFFVIVMCQTAATKKS